MHRKSKKREKMGRQDDSVRKSKKRKNEIWEFLIPREAKQTFFMNLGN